MLRTYALIAGMAVSPIAVAQDRNTIQSCLAYEMAAIVQSAPEGLTDAQAFAAGRELANRIPEPLFAAIRRLPDLQETGSAMVQAAQQSALSLSRQLTAQAVRREVDRCRTIFSPQTARRGQEERSFPPLRPYSEIASRVNKIWLNDGMLGVLNFLESCHGQNSVDGRDCVALDAAGQFMFDARPRNLGASMLPPALLEYFEASAQERRIATLESAQRGTRETLTRYYEVSRRALPRFLLEDIEVQTKDSKKSNCLVHDSDIADSYEGPCRDGLANGIGTARGRDEYSGGFLNGDVHGQGVYRWGDLSKWRSEVYDGGYYRGKRYGFGIWSIDINSNHPAKESVSKVATRVGTRYYRAGLWAKNTLIKSCLDFSECLDSDPALRTTLAATSRLLTAKTSGLQVSDVRAALFSDLQVLGQTRNGVEACFAGEVFSLARVDQTEARYLDREQAESIANLIRDRKLFAQLLIYCADVSTHNVPPEPGRFRTGARPPVTLRDEDQVISGSAISCNTREPTPDGNQFLLYKTRKGNLSQTVLGGPHAGQSLLYEPSMKPNSYVSGVVTVSIGKAFVIDFDGKSYYGTCSPLAKTSEAMTLAEAGQKLSENQARDILIQTVDRDALYKRWTKLECLHFRTEKETADHFDFGIFEKHDGSCPGDPETGPIVDRFRVMRVTRKLLWYEYVEGKYVAYDQNPRLEGSAELRRHAVPALRSLAPPQRQR